MFEFQPREQTNPGASSDAPYALRYSANRPEGRYATIEEAVGNARGECFVVTADGWWIVGSCVTTKEAEMTHTITLQMRGFVGGGQGRPIHYRATCSCGWAAVPKWAPLRDAERLGTQHLEAQDDRIEVSPIVSGSTYWEDAAPMLEP